MGMSAYAILGGVAASVHISGGGAKFSLFWCVDTS